jgi:hypothetical protein
LPYAIAIHLKAGARSIARLVDERFQSIGDNAARFGSVTRRICDRGKLLAKLSRVEIRCNRMNRFVHAFNSIVAWPSGGPGLAI